MRIISTARKVGRWMAILGFGCGVLYSVGGFFYDLFTIGLNGGTALAFLALAGMPLLFGVAGMVLGAFAALIAGAVRATAGKGSGRAGP